MADGRDQLRRAFPEALQLFGQFGEDYDYEFDKDERVAIADYIDGNTFVQQGIRELDALLERFPDNDAMRAALLDLGVNWTMWDQNDDWVPFVQRVRSWLIESLADPDPRAL
ncbi:hypothetical protein acdb102_45150 [Acidothermaceae bacterium B102]|nr:hypothetical protein acdb102_45150 [Acidothermaceae bacterium B102]